MRSLFRLFLLAVVIIANLKRDHEFVIIDTAKLYFCTALKFNCWYDSVAPPPYRDSRIFFLSSKFIDIAALFLKVRIYPEFMPLYYVLELLLNLVLFADI